MNLPFTSGQFFDVFAEYNRLLWPMAFALWVYALAASAVLALRHKGSRFIAAMLAIQWIWTGLVYHMAFFTAVNPAAWLFGVLFLVEGWLLAWVGVVGQLRFSSSRSPRHVMAWTLIAYALLYPLLAQLEGHLFPRTPTFGVPCPTTLLTAGFLLAADAPWPRAVALIPIAWAFVGGSASGLFGVRADLMLWVAGLALASGIVVRKRVTVRA